MSKSKSMVGVMNKIKGVIVDLSGTLHIENEAIPRSKHAIDKLQTNGFKVKYVTNTSKESLRLLHTRLAALDFNIRRENIFTSLTAANKLIKSRNLRPYVMLEPSAREDFTDICDDDPNAVVVGLAPSCFDYKHMNEAFRLLLEGAELIAINKARYFKSQDGMSIATGAFVAGLEFSTGRQAHVVGKPSRDFFLQAISDMDVKPEETVMIGDDVRDDVHGAIMAGMNGILVRTGKYRTGDEETIEPRPSAVCDSFAHAVDMLCSAHMATEEH